MPMPAITHTLASPSPRIRTVRYSAQASQRCMAVQVSLRVLEVLPISYTMDSIRFPLSLTPDAQTRDAATVPATSAPGLRSRLATSALGPHASARLFRTLN